MSIVLGIDPGVATVGFGVVKCEGQKVIHVAHGVIKTSPGTPFVERLHQIKIDLKSLLNQYHPVAVGVEKLFFAQNTKTALDVAHARGVILETFFESHIPLVQMTPLEVKADICGDGRADKIQVQTMVKMLLKLSALPKPDDAADALAIAIYTGRVSLNPPLFKRG